MHEGVPEAGACVPGGQAVQVEEEVTRVDVEPALQFRHALLLEMGV
jgi:hypothetical protein